MATIRTPGAGVSPYKTAAAAEPIVLTTTVNGRPSLVASTTIVNGQAALNGLITTNQTGVFQGANVVINLEEQNFNTTNQVTATTNYPSGNTGEIQYNSGANSFTSDPYFTYTSSNVVTPGIRTNGYFYGNGAPFIGGGNAAIGNFVFSGDAMTISDANQVMSITGNGTGNIRVTSNGNIWTFNNVGNLTLPSNSSSINYANGSPYGGGNYSNANVASFLAAFGSNVVSTTGNITAATLNANLYTAPGNITVTVGGNTWTFATTGNLVFPSGMHITKIGTDTRLSQDSGNLKLTANNTASLKVGWSQSEGTGTGPVAQVNANGPDAGYPGNVVVTTGNQSSTTYEWFFDNTGKLTAPGNITAGNLDATNLVINSIRSDDSSFVTIEDGVNVTSGSISAPANLSLTAGANAWTFAANGNLTAPGNITGANVIIANILSAIGDVESSNINAATLSAIGNVIANNAVITQVISGARLELVNTANVGNLSAVGSVSVAGNITGGNINTGGKILGNYIFAQSGATSAYATKRVLQYVEGTGVVTYSNYIDASSIYITGYAIEIHVSPSALDDSGNGTIGTPVKTIARAQVLAAQAFETSAAGQRKTIVLHPGDYVENVTISTQFTVLTTHELVGKNTTLSGTLTITKGCTIDGLKMTNLVISADNTTGSVDIIGCTVTTAVTKTSSAYTNFRGCDISSATLSITGTGSTVLVGGNYFTLTVNNAAAGVLAKSVVSMGPVTLTAGTLQLADTLIYAAANTSNAITQSAGSVITLNNCQTLIPDLTNVARNSFGGFYSILNAVYDKANSTFAGTSLSSILYSQKINADALTLAATTLSTSTATGALIVAGGAGIGGNVYVGNNITGSKVITTPAALSTLTAVAGARAFVNDGNLVASGNFGAQVAGGGGNTVPVWSDGTNWYIG